MVQRRKSDRECKPNDQPDWNGCISWQRMLVALVSSGSDPAPAIRLFIEETESILDEVEGDARVRLNHGRAYLYHGSHYAACLEALEARALHEGAAGPERKEGHSGVGKYLCACFRRKYPIAPAGFERIGRGGKV